MLTRISTCQTALGQSFLSAGRATSIGPPESLKKVVEAAPEPKEMVIVEGGDHFFEGHLPEMQAAIHAWVSRLFAPDRQAEAS